jgi:hypothetical protein
MELDNPHDSRATGKMLIAPARDTWVDDRPVVLTYGPQDWVYVFAHIPDDEGRPCMYLDGIPCTAVSYAVEIADHWLKFHEFAGYEMSSHHKAELAQLVAEHGPFVAVVIEDVTNQPG